MYSNVIPFNCRAKGFLLWNISCQQNVFLDSGTATWIYIYIKWPQTMNYNLFPKMWMRTLNFVHCCILNFHIAIYKATWKKTGDRCFNINARRHIKLNWQRTCQADHRYKFLGKAKLLAICISLNFSWTAVAGTLKNICCRNVSISNC